ncbi:hypothetical protein LDENG_00088930 [Lucifuga dentata]|nr:hypothetical protein LDENG_00088930 [Lucifuga dentata]
MKLWDSLTTCLILLSAVHASPLLRTRQQSTSSRRRARTAERPLELPPLIRLSVTGRSRAEAGAEDRERAPAGGGTRKTPALIRSVSSAKQPANKWFS